MTVDFETKDSVLIITINRPESLNALDVPTLKELREACVELRDNEALRVGVLTGAGDRAFCAGADLRNTMPPTNSFAEGYFLQDEVSIDRGLHLRALDLSALDIRKPLIAAINGHCLGGGMELALGCDIRVAGDNASFGLTEPRWGTMPGTGGISRLLRAVPRLAAMTMLLTGKKISAQEAYRIGLVSDLGSLATTLERALELAQRIASNAPLAVQAIHEITRRSSNLPLQESIALEQIMWGTLRDTADRIEGRKAFAEKRSPRYLGQ